MYSVRNNKPKPEGNEDHFNKIWITDGCRRRRVKDDRSVYGGRIATEREPRAEDLSRNNWVVFIPSALRGPQIYGAPTTYRGNSFSTVYCS